MRRIISLVFGVCAVAIGAGFVATVVKAGTLPNTQTPPGFSLTSVAEGLYIPTAAQFAPDGRIFVAQKNGIVKIVKNGQVLAEPFYSTPKVNDYADRGLLGMALDPNFATNKYVYLLFTYENNAADYEGRKTGRILRVTANGDTMQAGSEYVVLGQHVGTAAQPSCEDVPVTTNCIAADGLSHGPDTLLFGPDGKLYASIGESSNYEQIDQKAFRAQNLDSFSGKILRINPDGTGPADNPFYTGNPNDNKSKVYAYGMRNPFRLSIRPTDGKVLVGDVGWNLHEEINVVNPGANLGWPCHEGNVQQTEVGGGTQAYKDQPYCQNLYANPPANLTFPIHAYPHPPGSAIVGGVFYTGTNYPADYQNRYFFGDYVKSQINTFKLDANNQVAAGSYQQFAVNAEGPVQFFTGPDGDVYYVSILQGAIFHVKYSTTNQAPTAVADADKKFGPTPLTVAFTSAGSADPENDVLTYAWDFGDGTPVSNEANPTHVYTANGAFTAVLTVTDPFGNQDTENVVIKAGQSAPTLTISAPADMTTASAGQVIPFAGSAQDEQDGALTPDKLKWTLTIHHCPLDSCHVHSLLTYTGANSQFTFPAHDGPFYIQVTLSATNSADLTSTKFVNVYPVGQKINHAMQFDGANDQATAANSQDMKLQQFTAEAMVKTLATDTEGSEIMSMGNNWMVRLLPDGNVDFTFNSNLTWQHLTTTGVNIKDGLWHHIAVTKTGTTLKVYIDGINKGMAENAATIGYIYGDNFIVGAHGSGNDAYNFNGAIDEVRVWSVPRTDEQVKQYRSTTLPASGLANLITYNKAEEGNGTTAADSSLTQAHALALQNGATWTAGAPLSDPVPTNPANQLTDTFTGATVDANKWVFSGATTQTKQNDTLTVTPKANASGYYGLTSKKAIDLSSDAVFVEVPQTTGNNAAETQIILELNGPNKIIMSKSGTTLSLRHKLNDVSYNTSVPYDATAMRWWKIRETAGTVYLETSPDATTWTVQRSFERAFDLSKLYLTLRAGTGSNIANPGAAVFDNLNIPAAPNNAVGVDGNTGKATVNGGGAFNLQAFTVETWAKVQATTVSGGDILSNGNNYTLRALANGNLMFSTRTGTSAWKQHVVTGSQIKDNQWHHIAVTKDATTVKAYIDGNLIQTFDTPQPVSYTGGPNLVIGQHGNGDPAYTLTGQVDETRIWNVPRTAAEIAANWNKELSLPQSGLIGYWQYNQSTGTTINDASGGNHPLTMTAGAAWVAGFPKQ
ncbi:MAG TPA: LamG-like jellyroll fold domain-containing protein [Candidatus Saccharimonadales bacterium]|nr:LamG-like jellyroll fold domain-containing protein [Candidatus Saccharimonadales bacterium]